MGGLVYGTSAATGGERSASGVAARTGTGLPTRAGLKATLHELEKSYNGRIGAAGIDLETGRTVGYPAGERC